MSKIEWTEETWTPTTGCSRVSEGCRHCYAETMSARLANMGQREYQDVVKRDPERTNSRGEPLALPLWNNKVKCHPDRLEIPLRWRRPRLIFVDSMSDLFHPEVPFEFIDKVFAVMALCPQHTFQVLTKRPERMAEYVNTLLDRASMTPAFGRRNVPYEPDGRICAFLAKAGAHRYIDRPWPLDNVWHGTSCEDQDAFNRRAHFLTRIPGVRFLSLEPLLGPIRWHSHTVPIPWAGGERRGGRDYSPLMNHIHWVIVGGESGSNARPMRPDWVRAIRDQCIEAGVPFFFKQWGEWIPEDEVPAGYADTYSSKRRGSRNPSTICEDELFVRVGKKAAGRLLDQREWNEMPREKQTTR